MEQQMLTVRCVDLGLGYCIGQQPLSLVLLQLVLNLDNLDLPGCSVDMLYDLHLMFHNNNWPSLCKNSPMPWLQIFLQVLKNVVG